jgi:hypothetical protein
MAVAFGTIGAVSATTPAKPASTAAGDLLVIFWEADIGGTAASTGFTAAGRVVESTSGHSAGYLWKIATGSEGASFTVTGIGGAFSECFCVRYTGTHQTTPINVSSTGSSNNAAIIAPDITSTVNSCMEVCGVSYDGGNNNGTAPTGWTKRLSNNGNNWYFAERAQASAGATGTTDFSADGNTTGGNIAPHFCIAPPASGSTRPVKMAGTWGGYAGESGGFAS